MSTQIPRRISGRDKAALLLLSLGSAQSAAILSRLDPADAALISQRLSEMMHLTDSERNGLMDQFAVTGSRTEPTPAPPPIGRPVEPAPVPDCAGSADSDAVRAFDLSTLQRYPSRAIAATRRPQRHDPACFADLPVRCRAELPAIELPLSMLAGLAVGDVLTLGPSASPQVEFVGGEGLRLAGRLTEQNGRATVELANG